MADDDDWSAAEEELLERLLAVQSMKGGPGAGVAPFLECVPKEVADFRHALIAETDRACALHAGSYLDDALESLLRAILIDDADVTREMFKGSGPLATFSARTDMAFLLGLVSQQTRRELTLIRKIRNEFAHHAGHLRFTHPPIASRCHELKLYTSLHPSSPRARFCSSVLAVLGQIHGVQRTVTRREHAPDIDVSMIRSAVENLFVSLTARPESDSDGGGDHDRHGGAGGRRSDGAMSLQTCRRIGTAKSFILDAKQGAWKRD